MSRDLLFRAWHTEQKIMYWFELWGNCGQGDGYIGMVEWGKTRATQNNYKGNIKLIDPDRCEIMQYTGRYDRNDTQIYDGDIVKYELPSGIDDDSMIEYIEIVEWDNLGFECNGYPLCAVGNDIEVIGNVHQSPQFANLFKQ